MAHPSLARSDKNFYFQTLWLLSWSKDPSKVTKGRDTVSFLYSPKIVIVEKTIFICVFFESKQICILPVGRIFPQRILALSKIPHFNSKLKQRISSAVLFQSSNLEIRHRLSVKHFSVSGDRVGQHTWKQVGQWAIYFGIFDILLFLVYMMIQTRNFLHIWHICSYLLFLAYLTYLIIQTSYFWHIWHIWWYKHVIFCIFDIYADTNVLFLAYLSFLLHCSETEADKAHLPKCIRREVPPSPIPINRNYQNSTLNNTKEHNYANFI